jgi:5-deoxy-D-glucuronate isomerase
MLRADASVSAAAVSGATALAANHTHAHEIVQRSEEAEKRGQGSNTRLRLAQPLRSKTASQLFAVWRKR